MSWRLTKNSRRALLVVHIVAGVAWVGVNLAMFVLVLTALTSADGRTVAAAAEAVTLIIPPIVPALTVVTVVTGVVLGLTSKWGVITYWWVAVKTVISIVLTTLVWFVLTPGALAATVPFGGIGDQIRSEYDITAMLYPPVVSTIALIAAVWLSVAKPWGRVRPSTATPVRDRARASRV